MNKNFKNIREEKLAELKEKLVLFGITRDLAKTKTTTVKYAKPKTAEKHGEDIKTETRVEETFLYSPVDLLRLKKESENTFSSRVNLITKDDKSKTTVQAHNISHHWTHNSKTDTEEGICLDNGYTEQRLPMESIADECKRCNHEYEYYKSHELHYVPELTRKK